MSMPDNLRVRSRSVADPGTAAALCDAADRIEDLEAALRWYNDNDTVPGQVDDMGCGCCSRRVDVPAKVQAAWDSVTP